MHESQINQFCILEIKTSIIRILSYEYQLGTQSDCDTFRISPLLQWLV